MTECYLICTETDHFTLNELKQFSIDVSFQITLDKYWCFACPDGTSSFSCFNVCMFVNIIKKKKKKGQHGG